MHVCLCGKHILEVVGVGAGVVVGCGEALGLYFLIS